MADPLDRLEALLERATPGPWFRKTNGNTPYNVWSDARAGWTIATVNGIGDTAEEHANLRLIMAAPSVLREAIALARAARSWTEYLIDLSERRETDYLGDNGRAAEDAIEHFERTIPD